MSRGLKALINCDALRHNLEVVRSAAPDCKIMAMIKANGYGHGLIPVAQALEKAEAFGVASIEEALMLRRAHIQKKIVLMEGFFEPALELPEIIQQQFEPVIHHQSQLEALQNFSAKFTAPLSIWIKINTGMNRLGFPVEQTKALYESVIALKPRIHIAGWMTHFAQADEPDLAHTQIQIDRFKQMTAQFPESKSLANSAGILAWPASHADWVRPGIMLYGASPFNNKMGQTLGLKSVMTLISRVIAIQSLKQGDTIGYGGAYICPRPMNVAVIAIGYGDGYPQGMPSGTPVMVNNEIAPLVGRVSMDMITVDITDHETVNIGDPVELWGPNLSVEVVAKSLKTSSYELLTSPSSRVKFEYL